MTQFSWNYSCDPDTGDAGPLTAENLAAARLFLGLGNPKEAGVVFWNDDTPANILFPGTPPGLSGNPLDGLLEVSNAGGGAIEVATGVGFVLGRLFVNDDVVSFDTESDPGEAGATDLIVLRRNNLAAVEQSIRVIRKKATSPSSTAVVQQDGTIWEVALAEILLDGSGELDTVTDVRRLVSSPDIALLVQRQGGSATDWTAAGTTDYQNQIGSIQTGSVTTHGVTGEATVTFPRPFAEPPIVLPSGTGPPIVVGVITNTSVEFTADVAGSTVYWLAIGTLV